MLWDIKRGKMDSNHITDDEKKMYIMLHGWRIILKYDGYRTAYLQQNNGTYNLDEAYDEVKHKKID